MVGAGDPGWVTATLPCVSMDIVKALFGMVIAGCKAKPSAVTIRPVLSNLKEPARVKASVPSGCVI